MLRLEQNTTNNSCKRRPPGSLLGLRWHSAGPRVRLESNRSAMLARTPRTALRSFATKSGEWLPTATSFPTDVVPSRSCRGALEDVLNGMETINNS